MTGIRHAVVLAVALAVAGAGMATAAQQRPYRVSDQQLKDLVNRIDTHTDAFRDSFERAIDRSSFKGSPTADQAYRSMKDFNQAADLLRDRVNDRQSGASDAENLLRRASAIDSLMTRLQFETAAQRDWQALRLDMNDLTRAYGLAGNWSAASQNMPARVEDDQVKQLLKTIGQKADQFDKGLDRAFTNSQYDSDRHRSPRLRCMVSKGRIFWSFKMARRSFRVFRDCNSHQSSYAVAWYNKGITLSKLKRENEARYALDRAKELGSS